MVLSWLLSRFYLESISIWGFHSLHYRPHLYRGFYSLHFMQHIRGGGGSCSFITDIISVWGILLFALQTEYLNIIYFFFFYYWIHMTSSLAQNYEYKAKGETVEFTSLWTIWGSNPYSSDCSPVVSEPPTIVSYTIPRTCSSEQGSAYLFTVEKPNLHL